MKLRVWLLTVLVVLANVGGNAILKSAMLAAPASAGPITSILQPVALLGISVLTAWMLLRMWLLGMADLSFVVPVSAFGYVLNALAGVVFFHETVAPRGWIGTVLIMLGAALTGLTEHTTRTDSRVTETSVMEPRPQGAVACEPQLTESRPPFLSRDREGADVSSCAESRAGGAPRDGAATAGTDSVLNEQRPANTPSTPAVTK